MLRVNFAGVIHVYNLGRINTIDLTPSPVTTSDMFNMCIHCTEFKIDIDEMSLLSNSYKFWASYILV